MSANVNVTVQSAQWSGIVATGTPTLGQVFQVLREAGLPANRVETMRDWYAGGDDEWAGGVFVKDMRETAAWNGKQADWRRRQAQVYAEMGDAFDARRKRLQMDAVSVSHRFEAALLDAVVAVADEGWPVEWRDRIITAGILAAARC